MQSARSFFAAKASAQPGDLLAWQLAAAIGLHAKIDDIADTAASPPDSWTASQTQGRRRKDIQRLGYWRPAEVDLVRRYAGRCYADDPRSERDRRVGVRAMPMPNFGKSLTGNAAAMCCS